MAMAHWYETYKHLYTAEEREAEVTRLKDESKSLNSSQNRGDSGYTKDLAELKDKMQALARLREEADGGRSRAEHARGVVDFSGL